MLMTRYLLAAAAFILLFFTGCDTTQQKPRIMDQERQKIDYAKSILRQRVKSDVKNTKTLELESQKEIAKIEMQKAIEVEKIKAETKKAEILTKKEIAMKEAELKMSEIENKKSSNNWFMTLIVLLFSVFTIFIYRLFKEYQKTKLKLHKERMAHEANMKEKELQAQIVQKLIDAAGSGKLTPEQHERLLDSLNSSRRLPYGR